jgi:small-conductance mechanosensitive channel/CRP-like cAMP-binding protein
MKSRHSIRRIGIPLLLLLVFALLAFVMTEPTADTATGTPTRWAIILHYTLHIGVVLSGAFFAIAVMNCFVWDGLIARMLGTPIPRLVKDLMAFIIFMIGVTIIVGLIFKQSVTGIWATSSVLGFILGFALRSLILDVFTGLAINVDRSYKVGDWVHVHARNRVEYIGCILETNWRTTRLRTTENNIIVLPNSLIGQSVVTNFSAPDTLSRFELLFHLDFTVPTERALRILQAGAQAACGPEGIEAEPPPKVKLNRVTDIGVEYRLRYWLHPERVSPNRARHLVLQSVLHNLATAGLSLAYPKQDIYHTTMPSRGLNASAPEDKIALLASVDLFRSLPHEALQLLAQHLTPVTFSTGQHVVTAGDEDNAMFVIIEGILDVYVHSEMEQTEIKVGHVTAGQFFGEMALLTGKPRSATIKAATDIVAYEITHDDMMPVVETYPDVLETISRVIAERHIQEQQFLAHQNAKALQEQRQRLTNETLRSIRHFFDSVKKTVTSRRHLS